jgi:hypothetical protein
VDTFHCYLFINVLYRPDLLLESPMEDMTILINFLNGWKCPLASAVACLDELARTLVARGSLSKSNFEVIGKTSLFIKTYSKFHGVRFLLASQLV